MKTVIAGKDNISRLLGKQQLKENVAYRKMRYLLQSECEEGTLLHNVITGELVLLNNTERVVVNNFSVNLDSDIIGLIEKYFLVPVDFDEKVLVDKLRYIIKKMTIRDGINGYTIMTTTNCNARCFYCYQADYPHINMSKETADNLVNFMLKHKSDRELALAWFGGEPLVGIERINQICEKLQANRVRYVSSMISNGYLFTEEMVKLAISTWKLDTIQITLDGTASIYNNTKAYIHNDPNPYIRVIKNIGLLADHGVRVGIRLNLGQHNRKDLEEVMNELYVLRKKHGNIGVYAHLLFEGEGYIPTKTDMETRYQLFQELTALNNRAIDLGLTKYHLELPALRTHSCMADDNNAVVVYPDGKLFQCEHTALGDEFGDITQGITNHSNYLKFEEPVLLKECNSCPLYPNCIILKHCGGVADRNPIVCQYDVQARTRALQHNYARAIQRKLGDDRLEK